MANYKTKRAVAKVPAKAVKAATKKPSSKPVRAKKGAAEPKQPVMKRVEVLLFTGELADLLEAGMTLGQALRCLSNQGEEGSSRRLICTDLNERIENGETFSDAVKNHPKSFPPLFANMVHAGEASGAMIEVLRRLGDHFERYDNMRGKIKGAITYPIVVLIFGVIAVTGAMGWIVPQFKKVFDQLGSELPPPTKLLMSMSDWVVNYGWFMALVVAAVGIWVWRWKDTPSGRMKVDGWKLKMPLIKGIVACGAYSSLAYTLKTLLSNGVNVLNALKISEETCGNAVLAAALAQARTQVTDGTSISGPLASSGAFPRMMTDMLAVGEQAGNMASSLENIGKRYQKEMDNNIAAFTNALGPLLIVLIGGPIGFIAVAILWAVFAVSSSIG